jgi:hypothetical protein
MAVRVEPHAAAWIPAVRAFNARLTGGSATPDFLLDERAGGANGTHGPLAKDRYLVVDGGDVRGGFILQRQPFWIGGEVHTVANYQAPISEGLVDRRYAYLGMLMLKEALRTDPLTFCLGMGGLDRPFPRLLAAMGWRLATVPFMFRVARPRRVLRELPVLRRDRRRRVVADALALTGLASGAVAALRAGVRLAAVRRPRLRVDRIDAWGSWADEIWEASRTAYSMAAVRDAAGLEALYPPADPRCQALRLSDGRRTVGWAVLYRTRMQRHPHFGDLAVGTVLDCGALPGHEADVARAAACELDRNGVDLVITNQGHTAWVGAFRRAGFFTGPSNYVLALSRPLAEAVGAQDDGPRRIHATRGDADGRIHL